MKRYFFCSGLPRSRTAWLANFLTNGDSICLHGGLLEVGGDVRLLPNHMYRPGFTAMGNSDPSMLAPGNTEYLREKMPDAAWVFVSQNPVDSLRRHAAAFPEVKGVTLEYLAELDRRMYHFASNTRRCRFVCEGDLDRPDICEEIHMFCLGRSMNLERWRVLSKMRVQAHKGAWLASMSPETRAVVEAAVR